MKDKEKEMSEIFFVFLTDVNLIVRGDNIGEMVTITVGDRESIINYKRGNVIRNNQDRRVCTYMYMI